MKIDWRAIGIVLVVFCGVIISGCVDDSSNATNSAKTEAGYKSDIIVCPNPDCPLHDPNSQDDEGTYGFRGRPIDIEVIPVDQGNGHYTYKKVYLCQVCGEEWED